MFRITCCLVWVGCVCGLPLIRVFDYVGWVYLLVAGLSLCMIDYACGSYLGLSCSYGCFRFSLGVLAVFVAYCFLFVSVNSVDRCVLLV